MTRTTVGVSAGVAASLALAAFLLIPKGEGETDGRVLCTVYVPEAQRAALGAGPYARVGAPARQLADGGVLTAGLAGLEPVREELCVFEDQPWEGNVAKVPFDCACAKDATCLSTLPDGGTGPAPLGSTLGAGTFSGAGCVLKTCGVLAGFPEDWPADCGQ